MRRPGKPHDEVTDMDSIRELIEQLEKGFADMPAIKWLQGKDVLQKTYKEP